MRTVRRGWLAIRTGGWQFVLRRLRGADVSLSHRCRSRACPRRTVHGRKDARILYAVEWAGYFRLLKGNPDPKLVTHYLGLQMNAQDHGMLADLTDAITGLRERYRQAWLEESGPYRLGSAMAHWDAETQHWHDTKERLSDLLRNRKKTSLFRISRFCEPSAETLISGSDLLLKDEIAIVGYESCPGY